MKEESKTTGDIGKTISEQKQTHTTKYIIKPLRWVTLEDIGWEVADTSWTRYVIVCRKRFSLHRSTGYGERVDMGQFDTLQEAIDEAEKCYLINMENCLEAA